MNVQDFRLQKKNLPPKIAGDFQMAVFKPLKQSKLLSVQNRKHNKTFVENLYIKLS